MNDKTAEQLKCREAFEKWLQGTSGWKACKQRGKPMYLLQNADSSYNDFRVNDRWLAYRSAWNTRADSGEAVAYMLRMPGCFTGPTESDCTIAIQRAIDSMPAGTAIVPLYEHPSATADEARDAATFRRLVALRDQWERDEREHLNTFGQHLAASVACLVDQFDAALAGKRGE